MKYKADVPRATFKKWNPAPCFRCQDAQSYPSCMRLLLAAMWCNVTGSQARRLRGPRGPPLSLETLCNLADTLLPASLLLALAQLSSLNYPPFSQLSYPVLSLLCPSPVAGITFAGKASSLSQTSLLTISCLPRAEKKIDRGPALIELNC